MVGPMPGTAAPPAGFPVRLGRADIRAGIEQRRAALVALGLDRRSTRLALGLAFELLRLHLAPELRPGQRQILATFALCFTRWAFPIPSNSPKIATLESHSFSFQR